jgi:2-C-methyl-D-erythritol 4-phosphate cytidylyltransferase/2-C-methyl-D-erythritol 2,4-cyclodiphosphate synthase
VVAGGRGERLGGDAKQFRPLAGRPVACWAARALLTSLSGPVIVVLPRQGLDDGEALLRAHLAESAARLRFVPGGARRQDSVRAGLDLLSGDGAVLVHDAVRPFASGALVERVAREAIAGRIVVPAVAPADTLKRVAGERVIETVDRSTLVAVQTPQGFPLALLKAAHAAWTGEEEATDDAAVCECYGAPVAWVPGEALNRKLTGADDWWWAERVVESGRVRWEDRA